MTRFELPLLLLPHSQVVLRRALHDLSTLLLASALMLSLASPIAAQLRPPQTSPAQQTTTLPPPNDDESESEDEEVRRPRVTDPARILRAARQVYVRSNTVFVKGSEVEDSLRKRKEFQAWGMSITRSEIGADLIIEIERKSLTRRFTFSVLDPRTMAVLTSGKTRSVLFGKKIPNKIAEKFANRVKAVRPYPPA